jgi:hypothetical protein
VEPGRKAFDGSVQETPPRFGGGAQGRSETGDSQDGVRPTPDVVRASLLATAAWVG